MFLFSLSFLSIINLNLLIGNNEIQKQKNEKPELGILQSNQIYIHLIICIRKSITRKLQKHCIELLANDDKDIHLNNKHQNHLNQIFPFLVASGVWFV